jgi:hypothetical protein
MTIKARPNAQWSVARGCAASSCGPTSNRHRHMPYPTGGCPSPRRPGPGKSRFLESIRATHAVTHERPWGTMGSAIGVPIKPHLAEHIGVVLTSVRRPARRSVLPWWTGGRGRGDGLPGGSEGLKSLPPRTMRLKQASPDRETKFCIDPGQTRTEVAPVGEVSVTGTRTLAAVTRVNDAARRSPACSPPGRHPIGPPAGAAGLRAASTT